MADGHTHIKVRQQTKERLRALAVHLAEQVARGRVGDVPIRGDPAGRGDALVSLDATLTWLMDGVQKHHDRARKSAAKKKARKAKPPTGGTDPQEK